MSNLWTIFKKEVYRVISDRRLVLMIFIVPGLSIFIMYSIMGSLISNQIEGVQEHRIILYERNMPTEVRDMLLARDETNQKQLLNIEIHSLDDMDPITMEEKVLAGDIDIVLIFDEDFTTKVLNPDSYSAPTLVIHYNYGRQQSSFAHSQISLVLGQYRELLLINRLENPEHFVVFSNVIDPIIDERQVTGQGLAMLMPMLIVIFLFAGAMSIGPDSIAGEKERGTIATLLITPIKRGEIAIGKVVSLAVLSLISAISSFLGILLSLPRLMQHETNGAGLSVYGIAEYASILFILMATVLVITALIAVVSAYAKTIKEASMLIMPFYFITLIVGILSSFGQDPVQIVWVHFIPIYGAVNLLSAIFVFDWLIINFVVVIVSSIIYTMGFIYLLTIMFNSEKVMFQK